MFQQTRGNIYPKNINFKEAILNPSADFGGLYTLDSLLILNNDELNSLSKLSYTDFSQKIFSFLNLQLEEETLQQALATYSHFDNPYEPTSLVKINEKFYIQELYHGPTRAFKDMALQPFGSILSTLAQQRQEKYLILAATSGDTGPATLHSLANKKNVFVVCLYPHGGTSDIQRLQMTTLKASNLKVIGIKGNFDDAQSTLKQLLNDNYFKEKLKEKNILLSAANSVNFGRIAFQILYHAYAALKFYPNKVDTIIPSGNFGNALGAFYAKQMGFNIDKIIIASNANNILTDWIQTGIYNIKNRTLQKTQSPAMDILKSSNVERILFALFGFKKTKAFLESLEQQQSYALNIQELSQLQEHFSAIDCSDQESQAYIAHYAKTGYLIDPHTATGIKAYEYYKNSSENIKILSSTAEWTKFPRTTALALHQKFSSDQEALESITKQFNTPIHKNITHLFTETEYHKEILEPTKVNQAILNWL